MEKPNPLNSSSGFHRGRRKDTRKGLVSSTSSRRNTCKNKKCKTIRRRSHCRKHITRKISGGGSGELYVVVKYNDTEKPNDFKFEIDRVEYPGGTINWRKKGKSVALYRELVGKLKGVTGNMGSSKTPVASYTPGGPSSGQGMGAQGMGNNGYSNSYGSMTNNSYGMSNNANNVNNVNTGNNTGKNTGKNTGNNTDNNINKPSKKFCETGVLDTNEEYNQNIHNLGKTPKERCSKYYNEYLDNTNSKYNVDLLVDRIDEFVKDPKTKEAAKKLLANMDKVKIDPSVWSNFGQFLKKNGIELNVEDEKKLNNNVSYKVGDIIISYADKHITEVGKRLGLNIGRIESIKQGEQIKLKSHDNTSFKNTPYDIDYKDIVDETNGRKVMKLYDVDLSDDEITKIQSEFDRIDIHRAPYLLNINKDIIVNIAVDIQKKKEANQLNTFNIENFVDKEFLIDAAATGTTATKVTIPIGKDTTKFTPVEKIDTKFLEKFDIHNDIEKKDEFIKKINELPTVINSNFEKLNDLINENITNNDITIQWRKFLTDINQYANNNKKDSNFLKFQSSSSDDNHYYHMNDRITRAEKLFIENKSNIKNLIEVDYKNKAFNIPGSGSLTSKIDKLKNYYNKLITDINSDNTKIKVLIEKYNSKSIDNSRFTITKIKNVFTKDELTQIENLTKNMKAKTDSINNFLEKCSNVIKKVIEEIFEMINLITTCKIIIRAYINNKKIKDLLDKYKINIKLDNTNNTNTNTYNDLTTKNVKDAMNKHINNNNIVGNIVIWFDKKINNFVAGIINKIKIINDKIIVENATSLNGINNNITEDEDQVIVPIKLVENNLDTQLEIAEKTISSAIDNNISLKNIDDDNTKKLLTILQEEVFENIHNASLENNKEDDNSFKENFKLAMALKMFDENDENDDNAQNLSQLPSNTINNNAINNYSINKSEDPAPVNHDYLKRTVYGINNNNSNPWERYH